MDDIIVRKTSEISGSLRSLIIDNDSHVTPF